MNANQNYFNKALMFLSALLLTGALMGMVTAGVQPDPVSLSSKRTPTPTRTPAHSPTPTNTPTPTGVPSATPTPGPTTVVAGSWKIVSSPNVGTGTYGNKLNAVTVVSGNDVWAVGFSPAPSGTPLYIRQSLIELWDGSQWNVITSPNPAGKPDVELNGVAAVSANDVWAVGHSGDPSSVPYQTLTENWNGTGWSIVSSPNPGAYNGNDLASVAAISSNDVWAVGWYQQSSQSGLQALTMHWDGTSWTVVSNPGTAELYAITAISSNNVWAVGSQIILHWNGTVWSNVSFPLPPGGNQYIAFKGISATSANDVWAVGYRQWPYNEGYLQAPITYHWDGTSWSLIYNAGMVNEVLSAVTAIASNDVWAVGDNGQLQYWNGATWIRVSAPYPDDGGSFNGVAAASASDVWAVGTYDLLTWIDRYTVP